MHFSIHGRFSKFRLPVWSGVKEAAWLFLSLATILSAPTPTSATILFRLTRSGFVELQNIGTTPIEFTGYQINSTTNLLDPETWNGITAQAQRNPDFVTERLGPGGLTFGIEQRGNGQLIERTVGGPAVLGPGAKFNIGQPFQYPGPAFPDFPAFRDFIHGPTVQFLYSTAPGGSGEVPAPVLWEPLDGDVDQDGAVGIADFAILRSNFGLATTGDPFEWDASADPATWSEDALNQIWGMADMDYSLRVDIVDFSKLRTNFGKTVLDFIGPPPPEPASLAAPEPGGGLAAMGLGLAVAAMARRRMRAILALH